MFLLFLYFRGIFYHKSCRARPLVSGVGSSFGPQILIWKDMGPVCFWSRGHSYGRGVYEIKVVGDLPNNYLVRLDTPFPDPWGQCDQMDRFFA